jgi:DNA-binding CsgD family transcriptional regulator/tetratricopeptide (TPR) repeat protein
MVRRGPLERVSPLMIGRDDVIALAHRRWAGAMAGSGHLLLVAGEAGIGKTRLLHDFANSAGSATIVDAGAFPRDGDAAGAVVLAISDGLRRSGRDESARAVRARLLAPDPDGDAARRRRLLAGDLADLILAALSTGPTLLRIEDLHWADDLSLEVLERVAALLTECQIMIMATYRTDELYRGTYLGSWRARLLDRRAAEEIVLRRLSPEQIATVVEAITEEVPSGEFVASLQRRSDGIPLHIEELIAGDGRMSVPDTVAEAVTARVAELDAHVRDVLAASSVIGRSFDIDLLAAVVDSPPSDVDFAVRSLVDAHLLTVRDEPGEFVFRHALICDAVYSTVPPLRKRALHSAVAHAAEEVGMSDSFISEHFERARDAAGAYRHARAGAAAAIRVSAHREAAELLRRAQRTIPREVADLERAELHRMLATELAAIDDNEDAAANFEAAIEQYRTLGDELAAAELVPDLMSARHLLGWSLEQRTQLALDALRSVAPLEPSETSCVRSELFGALAAAHMLDRRLDEAIDYGAMSSELNHGTFSHIEQTIGSVLVFAGHEEGWERLEGAVRSAAAAGREAETARGYRMIGSCASMLVEYERADRWIAEGLEYTWRTERWNDHHYLASHLANVRWAQGEWAEADAIARHALADGRGITTRITALTVLGWLAMGRGDAAADSWLAEALELAEPMNELQRVLPVLWGLAERALLAGDARRAIELCEQAYVRASVVKDAAYLFPFVLTGTRALLAGRERTLARGWLARCADLLNMRRIPGTLPALLHAQGLIELADGRTGDARALLEDAQREWTRWHRFWEGTEASIDLAVCAIRSRRPRDAARLVADVRARAGAARADALIARADTVGSSSDLGPLSVRELDVARLIASGLTNREIAQTLVIAPKTVSAHVEHILAKLGAARRAEIASWVARTQAVRGG